MTERNLLELLVQKVTTMEDTQQTMKSDMGEMKSDISGMKVEIGGMKSQIGDMKAEMGDMKSDISNMKSDIKEIKADVRGIKGQIIDLEVKNANQHLEIKSTLDSIKKDLATVEAVAGKNMADIAFLKAAR